MTVRNVSSGIELAETAAPTTPATGWVRLYAKADGKVYIKDDTGAETDITTAGAGGGGGSRVFAWFAS
jgi:hypothetical protein